MHPGGVPEDAVANWRSHNKYFASYLILHPFRRAALFICPVSEDPRPISGSPSYSLIRVCSTLPSHTASPPPTRRRRPERLCSDNNDPTPLQMAATWLPPARPAGSYNHPPSRRRGSHVFPAIPSTERATCCACQ